MLDNAADAIAVLARDQLGTVSPFIVAPASRLGTLVTDAAASEAQLAAFRKLQMRILTA